MPYKDKEKGKVTRKAYYVANLEKVKARIKAYREANLEKVKARDRAYYKANRESLMIRHRAYSKVYYAEKQMADRLWYKFNLTLEQYNTMLDSQGFVCALCGAPELSGGKGKRLAVDHCHTTGKIRKLLCDRCNLGLGMFNDDPALLERAAKYLHYHQKVALWETVE